MNRKILVLFILIGLLAIIGVGSYAAISGVFEGQTAQSEVESEQSEVVSEVEPGSELKDPNEGVDTEAASDGQTQDVVDGEVDENGDLIEDSKYLDSDGDTVANYFDECPGVDDFSTECTGETADTNAETTTDTDGNEYDDNGDLRSESKYLDDDGDTVANYYDLCPDVDDFSSECAATSDSSGSADSTDSSDSSNSSDVDNNGDARADSKYLDDDGDTVANYYDICPGVDDFSSECETDAYN